MSDLDVGSATLKKAAPALTDEASAVGAQGFRPLPFVFVLGLLPSVLTGDLWVATLIWTAVVSAATAQIVPEGWTRQIGGGIVALGGSLALMHFAAWELRPLAVLLFLPGLLGWVVVARGGERAGAALLRAVRYAPPLTGVAYALIVLGTYQLGASSGAWPQVNDDFLYPMRETPPPAPLTEEEQLAAIDVVRAAIRGHAVDLGALPPRLQQPSEGRIFVTLHRPARRANRARGAAPKGPLGAGLAAAATAAMEEAPARARWLTSRDIRIVIDLAGEEQRIKPSALRRALSWTVEAFDPTDRTRWDPIVYDAEPGVDGFRLVDPEGGGEGIVLPGDVLAQGISTPRSRRKRYRMHDFEKLHRRLAKRAGLPRDTTAGSLEVSNFRTFTFAAPDPRARRAVELYRHNVLLEGEPTDALLLERIDLAGKWLLSTVEADGRFDYEYFPTKDDHGTGYNEVRHAGSVYGLFHMVHLAWAEPALRDDADAYLRASIRAMDRIYPNLAPAPGVDAAEGMLIFDEGPKSNSGAVALTLLSFLERPSPDDVDDPELKAALWREGDDAVMEGLAKTLVFMIDDRGKLYEKWDEAVAGGGVDREPLYYPGEAMLALVRYHERTGEARWLEAAKAIGRRQIPYARKWYVVPDHWVMQALDKLDALDPERSDEWRRGAYAMGARYVSEQFASPGQALRRGPRQHPPFPDYRGAYRRVQELPRTTRAASRGEAIGGVARIAWRHGDPAEHWERSLIEGARHLMEQQYVPDNSFFLPDPDEVQGAIRMGIIDMHCRIDNNQHGIVALGNALQALRRQAP